MKNRHLLLFLLLISFSINIAGQEELTYIPEMSAKKKGTKSKQLEGMDGTVEKVTILSQKDHSVEINIHQEGYDGKQIKVFALSKSGTRIVMPITPFVKKVSSGKKTIKARLNLSGDNQKNSDFIEVVITNGIFRLKGISYVYEFKKQWSPKGSDAGQDSSSLANRPSRTIVLELKPVGTARRFFNQ
ncbi:hypothetical protein [Flavivirga jejuensis]|uniref:PEGA domain-containing protein n=1 Tax=Flavivirga jejuensis TaxID=870487 RepID=A0ABT8WTD8_9FLAO|nr:hypothetical protein [Flavivirga jejuensis]MDO5976239.1 hypothetical protein [Flavivirga jejuensis]